ncbi:hypothetical protein JHD46_00180 [Sulfurimonas sp. SAG-AH-194-C20]|nr:hypothetical protein [Sulfurimonas sp. SAG-AH-194-C20]MDF1878048.1 hypothetical protein [Sulfurimonas sp. SAG-AH-194-C20]
MSRELEEQTKLILKELQEYKADNSYAKPLFQSMKEISTWLAGKEK